MNNPLISQATLEEFREVLVVYSLKNIDKLFSSENFYADPNFFPEVQGARRALVERYYNNINMNSISDVQKLVRVFDEIILIEKKRIEDGWSLSSNEDRIEQLNRRMIMDGFIIVDGRFKFKNNKTNLEIDTLTNINNQNINEHYLKIHHKMKSEDYSGAIANAYTLTEELLKYLLDITNSNYNKKNEGDIRQLYKELRNPLNLSPANDKLEKNLKTILDGLQKQIAGLYEVANKASDRHARVYNPSKHHAKLTVNSCLTLCEFLIDSYNYQFNNTEKSQCETTDKLP